MGALKIDDVFAEIERAAEKNALLPREAGILRLLGEEMFSMTTNLAERADCTFVVSGNKKQFELRLSAKAYISPANKRSFVSVSSRKENMLEKGLLGKIRMTIEDLLFDEGKHGSLAIYADVMVGYDQVWSLNDYMQTTPADKQKEDWDGLERSILINMADDIIIGANSGRVEMTVKKSFE